VKKNNVERARPQMIIWRMRMASIIYPWLQHTLRIS